MVRVAAVALLHLFVIGVAAAEEPSSAGESLRYAFPGYYRVSATSLDDLRVDASGRLYGQHYLATHRLTFAPVAQLFEQLELGAELQLAASHLAAEDPDPRFADFGPPRAAGDAFAVEQLELRKLYADWRTPVGVLRLGRVASHWGAGILANGGDDNRPDWGEPRFGRDNDFGDVVNRVMFATTPLAMATGADWANHLFVALGADLVERDERTVRSEGDTSYQGIGAVRYARADHEIGLYVAYRDFEDSYGDTLDVWAYDLFGKGTLRVGQVELSGLGELAWVLGETTLGRNNAFTDTLEVQQLGYVLRGGATYLPWRVGGDVELGYASGDSNPNDGFVRNFSFDPEYNPSLILFEELRAAETVAAQASASDPSQVGYPPDAVRQLPTKGAVTNAIYVRPTVRYAWGELRSRLAATFARAEEAVVDPYNSTLAGGVPRNFQGGSGAARDLGIELDVGVDYTYRFDRWAEVSAALQGGRLWPGKAFRDAAGATHPPIDLVFAQLIVKWLPAAPPAQRDAGD